MDTDIQIIIDSLKCLEKQICSIYDIICKTECVSSLTNYDFIILKKRLESYKNDINNLLIDLKNC